VVCKEEEAAGRRSPRCTQIDHKNRRERTPTGIREIE
jgi:hypothetical protein